MSPNLCCLILIYMQNTSDLDFHITLTNYLIVALTDGKTVYLDANLRPQLHYKGIVSKNKVGQWNVLCSDQIDVVHNGAQTAGEVCSILGFRYRFRLLFHNVLICLFKNFLLTSSIFYRNCAVVTVSSTRPQKLPKVSSINCITKWTR